tara:strand:+ start:88 stop:690 length:603 start_codon:yes stop_codon:yes gene_type:complete
MILGLDHISLNTKDKKDFKKKFFRYDKVYEKYALNHKEKKLFLKKKIKNHYIGFYSIKKNLPPIEKTYYGIGKSNANNIKIKKNKFFLSVYSIKQESLFWKKVFNLDEKKNIINFYSLYDQKKYKFYFNEKYKGKEYLDFIGYTTLCFVSSDINKIFKSCKDFNIEITKIFNYEMNKKKMKIFFFRSPGGLIFEIVQYLL